MTPTMDDGREPDVVITTSCEIEGASFADVDRDGVDDLLVHAVPYGPDHAARAEGAVYLWPSSRGIGPPLVWQWSEDGEAGWMDVSTPNPGPVRVQWSRVNPDGVFEFEVDPVTLQLVQVGEGFDWYGHSHIGDVDGDGLADLFADAFPGDLPSVRASSTGAYTDIPGAGSGPSGYEYWPRYVASAGDVNHDGYDDVVVGQRRSEPVENECPGHSSSDYRTFGPVQLFLGSATGLQTEPLWTLSAPGHPYAGIGRGVASLPDEQTMVVTLVTEGSNCGDLSPEFLGVIRDADTPDAWFEQFAQVAEFTPGHDSTPRLEGVHSDEAGQPALVLTETGGVQWVPWFSDGSGLHTNADGVAVPSSWWPEADVGNILVLSHPLGGHYQVFHIDSTYSLAVWGRTVDQMGIPPGGVTTGDCTFTASGRGGVDAATGGTRGPGPTRATTDPFPEAEARGCGCDASGGWGHWLVVVLPWLFRRPWAIRGRRPRYARRADATGRRFSAPGPKADELGQGATILGGPVGRWGDNRRVRRRF